MSKGFPVYASVSERICVSWAMYSCAICSVSNLLSGVSGPSPGSTVRSLSKPWFSKSILRLSRALAASLLFLITDSGRLTGSDDEDIEDDDVLSLTLLPPAAADFTLDLVGLLRSSFCVLVFLEAATGPWPRLLRSTGRSSDSDWSRQVT